MQNEKKKKKTISLVTQTCHVTSLRFLMNFFLQKTKKNVLTVVYKSFYAMMHVMRKSSTDVKHVKDIRWLGF